ncbi:MAG: AI-2E family transporter [Bacteroidales bacterium]|nr:AI-2E family transporter [Bacteroidales bacterium]
MKRVSLNRVNDVLLFFILFTILLYFGRGILTLFVFSGFLAMLMTPVSNKLEGWGLKRIPSTLLSVLLIIIILSLVMMLISIQIATLLEDLPNIQNRLEEFFTGIQAWIENLFGFSPEQQIIALKEQAKNTITSAGTYLTNMVKGLVTFIASFAMVLVLTFLFILHREKYENFLFCFIRTRNEKKPNW